MFTTISLFLLPCVLIYIRTLPLFPGSGGGIRLQAAESLLQLHQLTPQGVFLSQDSGDHGLGFISGEVRLNGQTRDMTHRPTSIQRLM